MLFRSNKKSRYTLIIVGALIALFLATFLSNKVLFLFKPLLFLKNQTTDFFEKTLIIWQDKKELQVQNVFLKQQLMELQTERTFCESLLEENEELRQVFSLNKEKTLIAASIIMRPGYGVYNELIVDKGSKDGIKEGMPVSAFGNILLGHVFEVTNSISKVRLISFPEKETNIFIGDTTTAISIGRGGENLEISLPYSVDIQIGDYIGTLGVDSLFLGLVEKVIKEPEKPFQTILFRLPVNIQELRRVYIII